MMKLLLVQMFLVSGDYDLVNKFSSSLDDGIYKTYVQCISSFQLKDKQCQKFAQMILDENDFNKSVPKRYIAIAEMVLDNSSKWKDNDLGDIERDMKISKNRLNNGYADNKTKEVQSNIIKKLDKLIKEKEDSNKDKEISEKIDIPQNPNSHANDSEPSSNKLESGNVTEKNLKKFAQWGKMPDSKRKLIMHELMRDFPEKYRDKIESYNKTINKLSAIKQ